MPKAKRTKVRGKGGYGSPYHATKDIADRIKKGQNVYFGGSRRRLRGRGLVGRILGTVAGGIIPGLGPITGPLAGQMAGQYFPI